MGNKSTSLPSKNLNRLITSRSVDLNLKKEKLKKNLFGKRKTLKYMASSVVDQRNRLLYKTKF